MATPLNALRDSSHDNSHINMCCITLLFFRLKGFPEADEGHETAPSTRDTPSGIAQIVEKAMRSFKPNAGPARFYPRDGAPSPEPAKPDDPETGFTKGQ